MTLATLLVRNIDHGPYKPENYLQHENSRALATSRQACLDRTWKVMDESHVWCFLGKGLKGQRDKRAGVATLRKERDLPSWEVARVNWTFFTTSEYADDTTKCGGSLEEWQEVDDESVAGVIYQGCGQVEAFWSLCGRTIVRPFYPCLQNVFCELERSSKNRGHTRIANQRSRAET